MVVTWAAHGCTLSAAAAPSSASAAAAETGEQWVALRRQSLPLLRCLCGQQVDQQEVALRRQALPRAWRQALPPL